MIPDADCWLKGGWGGRQHLLKGGGLIKGVLNKLAQQWVKINRTDDTQKNTASMWSWKQLEQDGRETILLY